MHTSLVWLTQMSYLWEEEHLVKFARSEYALHWIRQPAASHIVGFYL